ncbi:MAG: murein biosynthesis integral membrane protein MurJ [Chloroflexota bacterium]
MSHVARSSLLIAFFFAMEKALGFIRQVAIARTFGLSESLDAFYASNNIPDLLFYLISGGALALAFIPLLSETLQNQGREEMWDLFSRMVNVIFLVGAVLSIVIALLAEKLVSWQLGIAPGFTPEQRQLVADLMRLHLVSTLLLSLGGLVAGSLQTNQHFFLPALALSMYDLGTLFGIFILVPEHGPLGLPGFNLGVYGLVYGTITGSALFLLIQVPGLLRYGFRWTPALNLHHPGLQRMLGLLGPRVLTILSIQLTYIAQDNIASRLHPGNVTALVYGWLFMQVPETLIGSAIATALLPTLSEQIARQEIDAYRQSLRSVLRVLLALTLPIAALLAVVLRPAVALLHFDQAGSELVLWTARIYLIGLAGHAILEVVVRAFYSQKDAITPLIAAGLTTLAFIILAMLFGFPYGAPGIALANALAFGGEALLLLFLFSRRVEGILQVRPTLLRAGAAGLLAAGVAYLITHLSLPFHPLLLAIAAGGIGLLLILPFIWSEVKILVRL